MSQNHFICAVYDLFSVEYHSSFLGAVYRKIKMDKSGID